MVTYRQLVYTPEKEDNTLAALEYTGGEEDTFGLSDLTEDHNYNVIEQQMSRRFGMSEKSHDRQEVVDKYINYMRNFNAGNSLSVLTEASYLNVASEEKKVAAYNAYKLWDNAKGAFEGGTAAQKLDNVLDYGRALVADPVNLLSFGVGKLATGSASKITASAAKEALELSVQRILSKNNLAINTPRSKLSPKIIAAIDMNRNRILTKALKGDELEIAEELFDEGKAALTVASGLSKAGTKGLRATFATDTGASITIDSIQQNSLIGVEYQDEFSYINAPLIAGMGFFGYGLAAAVPHFRGDKLPQSVAFDIFDKKAMAEANFKKRSREEGVETNKAKIDALMADKGKQKALADQLQLNSEAADRWAETVRSGTEGGSGKVSDLNDVEGLKGFLLGNEVGNPSTYFDGLSQIFEKAGLELQFEEGSFVHLTDFITATVKSLDDSSVIKKEIKSLYDTTLKKLDPTFKDMEFGSKAMDVLGAKSSDAGRRMQIFSALARSGKEIMKRKVLLGEKAVVTPMDVLDDELNPITKDMRDYFNDKQSGFQRNFIKTLVTHPGTTALNLLGWTQASVMQTGSDLIRSALYSTRSVGSYLMGNKTDAVEFGSLAKHMRTLQIKKFNNLMNPFATQQETLNFISQNPKLQKDLFRYVSGGVESKDVAKDLGIYVDDLEKPGVFESILDKFQTVYGVKAVDILSKTQEFMYNIDKQIRLKYNITYDEFMRETVDMIDSKGMKIKEEGKVGLGQMDPMPQYKQEPKHWQKMNGNDFYEVQTKALDDTLRTVFSKSYGGGDFNAKRGTVESVAKVIEDARKMPIIGAMIPFGQFFNNTIAFMADHVGITYAHKYFTKSDRDWMELHTKTATGAVMVSAMADYEYKNMEEGLSWHQERDADGQVRSRLYDFPFSFWKAIGRMGAHWRRDGEIPQELLKDISTTFGPANLTRTLGDTAKGISDMFEDAALGNNQEAMDSLTKFVGGIAPLYASGFTRPLDPLNQVAAFAMGDAYNERDRKIGTKALNNSFRYVDGIYDALKMAVMGEETPEFKKQSTVQEGSMGVPIGRVVGYRAEAPPNELTRMFADMGKPNWQAGIKSAVPEADNRLNQIITKHLIEHAAIAISKPEWKTATQEVKRSTYVNQVLAPAKRKALRELYRSGNPDDKRYRLMYKLSHKHSGVKMLDMEKALAELGIDKEVADLSYRELITLRNFLRQEKREVKRSARMLGR